MTNRDTADPTQRSGEEISMPRRQLETAKPKTHAGDSPEGDSK